MGFLIDQRFAEVASYVESNQPQTIWNLDESAGPVIKYWKDASRFGYSEQVKEEGAGSYLEVLALEKAVKDGFATGPEAQAYLSQKYPDQNWSGGVWGDQTEVVAAQQAENNVQSQAPDVGVESVDSGPLELAQEAQSAATGTNVAEIRPVTPIVLDGMPDEYDPDSIQNSIDSVLLRITSRFGQVENGGINFTAHSIPGDALTPGTVPFAALNQRLIREALEGFPGPDQAITLSIAPVTGMDNHVGGGPRRIWRVVGARLPSSWTPGPGPLRFRIVADGQKFGVMGTRMGVWNGGFAIDGLTLEVSYGIVILGIPSYGRAVERLIRADYVGDGPSSYATEEVVPVSSDNTDPFQVFEAQPKAAFQDTMPTYMTPFGTDATLLPDPADALAAPGFSFQLIRGRTAQEVFQELCTRSTAYGRRFVADGSVEGTVIGTGAPRPPVSGQVIAWDGEDDLDGRDDSDDLTSEGRIVEGVPFLYKDCRRLSPTNSTFSIVVQPTYTREVTMDTGIGAPATPWTNPSGWSGIGLQTVSDRGREWKLDIVVQ